MLFAHFFNKMFHKQNKTWSLKFNTELIYVI